MVNKKNNTKILFISDSGETIDEIIEKYKYYTPNHDNKWKEVITTSDINEADYVVVLDGFPGINRALFKNSKIKLKDLWEILSKKYIYHKYKIFFQREPINTKKNSIDLSSFIFKGIYKNHYHVSTWMIKIPFDDLNKLKKPEQFKSLSAIISSKKETYGQKKRLDFVREVSKLYKGIDIFGRGLENLDFGDTYKGPLNYNDYCKFKGLYEYRYSLAFENSSHENYFTEKITDCFLCWAKPIYWGCPNISDYFPEKSFTYIDIFDKNAPMKIIEEIEKPVDYNALREARQLVLYKYNIYPSVLRIIKGLRKTDFNKH